MYVVVWLKAVKYYKKINNFWFILAWSGILSVFMLINSQSLKHWCFSQVYECNTLKVKPNCLDNGMLFFLCLDHKSVSIDYQTCASKGLFLMGGGVSQAGGGS